MSDRDKEKRTFTDKKEADALDKKLELAESLREFFESKIPSLTESLAEEIGMLIADNKTNLMTALKGKPSVLLDKEEDLSNVENIADKQKAS